MNVPASRPSGQDRSPATPGRYDFAWTIDAATPDVPATLLRGRADGPRLALVAGVHGNELDGPEALLALRETLDPASLRGQVLIVPVANPAAFAAGQRRHPADDVDLNRVFPGRPDGGPCERLAARLAELLLRDCDFLLTLHGWHAWGATLPHVEYDAAPSPIQAVARAAAHACGFGVVVATDWPAGLLPKAAGRAGIPAIEAEIGGEGVTSRAGRAEARARVADLMAHLGMLDAPRAPPLAARSWRHASVLAESDCLFRPEVEPGQAVVAGAPLGRASPSLGAAAAPVAAPSAGLVLCVRTVVRAKRGDPLVVMLVEAG